MNTILTKAQMRWLGVASLGMVSFNLFMASAAMAFHHRGAAAGHVAFAFLCYGLARYYAKASK